MDLFFQSATHLGSLYLLIPAALGIGGYMFLKKRQGEAKFLITGLAGVSGMTHILKALFARPRPPVTEALAAMPADYSFPSAHTSQSVTFFIILSMILSRNRGPEAARAVWAGCMSTAVVVAVSRVYLEVHYLSDVVAGAGLGILWVWALNRVWHRR